MAQLTYTRDEILADGPYAKPHVEAGYKLHGGFDETGTYVSPRTARRWEAIQAWNASLKERGWPLIDASQKLLTHGHYPSTQQEKVLLNYGIGQPLWNGLTITGVIEARGRALCDFTAPDFQDILEEDLSETGVGHINKGLFYAHGLDEGGDPASGIGAHDAMWFAVRDMVFGKEAYPLPEIPESISRPVEGRELPDISPELEGTIKLMMDVLMIEVRAEDFFAFCQSVMRDPDNFKDRRKEAELGAEIVERIRTDEAVHVAYLQTLLSELRSFHFKTVRGSVLGADLLDPLWERMIDWHANTRWQLSREQSRDAIRALIKDRPDGEQIWGEFEACGGRAAA